MLFSNPREVHEDARKLMDVIDKVESVIRSYPTNDPPDRLAAEMLVHSLRAIASNNAHQTLVLVLSNYKTTAAQRKVLEQAAREFSKKKVSVRRGQGSKRLWDFRQRMQKLRVVLLDLIMEGKLLKAAQVHAFVLVNAGGFNAKVVQSASGQVKRSGELLADKGFEELLYGEVVLTNTVLRGGHVLAFYLEDEDKLYIRANRRNASDNDMVHAVIHELGHRMYKRFLSVGQKYNINILYKMLKDMPYSDVEGPYVGQEVKDGTSMYRVVDVSGYSVALENLKTGNKAGIARRKWPLLTGKSPFVSQYASTTPEENFCEMFAFYAMNKPMVLKDQFESILGEAR